MPEFIRNSATLGKYVSVGGRKFRAIFFFCCNRFHDRVFQRGTARSTGENGGRRMEEGEK